MRVTGGKVRGRRLKSPRGATRPTTDLVRSAILASAFRGVDVLDILTEDLFGYIVVGLGVFIAVGRVR